MDKLKIYVTDEQPENLQCVPPVLVQNGVPWSECRNKIAWLNENWMSNECYAQHGVDGSICSIITYLTEVEKVCPMENGSVPNSKPLYYNGEKAVIRVDLSHLIEELSGFEDFTWIRNRIHTMRNLWVNAANTLFRGRLKNARLHKKRIHIHLGLLDMGMGSNALHGGPLGELVQWSDLIASLYILGHDIVISHTEDHFRELHRENIHSSKVSCQRPANNIIFPFDVVYTDIRGFKIMAKKLDNFNSIKCYFRVLDSFGTEASFNVARKSKRSYGGLRLNLKQFNTMFPHTPDNTFLGFVVENPLFQETLNPGKNDMKRDIALVYGKEGEFWAGKRRYLEIFKEYFSEIHGTVSEKDTKNVPEFVVNHGVLPMPQLFKLLRRTKLFIGLEFPYEGPAPLEAIAMGAKFLNPRLKRPINSENSEFYANKPTRRFIKSQNPYAEDFIGKPYAYTVLIENEAELREALEEIRQSDNTAYLPHEFSAVGMLERVAYLVEKQEFCDKTLFTDVQNTRSKNAIWPPTSSLRIVTSDEIESCNDACQKRGLLCEPTFFPLVNQKEIFQAQEFMCNFTNYRGNPNTDFPAYDRRLGVCFIQTDDLYFSCAGKRSPFQRICPCRDFQKDQIVLSKDCSL